MRGHPGCRRRLARATGLSPVGPSWADAESAQLWGWCVALSANTAFTAAVPCLCVRSRQVCRVRTSACSRVSSAPPPPLLRPRSPRCVWRVVPSGCPLFSPAGTLFPAVCSFSGLRPVAPQVRPTCPLCVCALALPRHPRPPPLPGSLWRAHFACFRCRAPVGPFHAIRATPRFLPQSRAPSS